MELTRSRGMKNGGAKEMDGETSTVRNKRAYIFDGLGNFYSKDWDLTYLSQKQEKEGDAVEGRKNEFSWYHVEIPKGNEKLSQSAQDLIGVLCPPLNLQDILSLVSNEPFCAYVDGALVFRVNSPGPPSSDFTFRIAARVTENSVITVSLGRVPRLDFSRKVSLLSDIPRVESSSHFRGQQNGTVIEEHVLEFFLTMNHSEETDNPVPRSVSNLVVHIIDTHIDQLQDLVTKLEIELDSDEINLDKGGYFLKKQMLDNRRFPKMHINLQRLLQNKYISESKKNALQKNGLQVKIPTHSKLRRMKENVGFIVNRVTAIQAGLDSWQSEQINRKLYYLSFLSIVFLPLSIITGVFGMNVGGVPWTGQNNPELKDGFRNVIVVCAAMVLLVLLCFLFPALYTLIAAVWRDKRTLGRSWSLNMKSLLKKPLRIEDPGRRGYLRI